MDPHRGTDRLMTWSDRGVATRATPIGSTTSAQTMDCSRSSVKIKPVVEGTRTQYK